VKAKKFYLVASLVTLLLAGVLSFYASSSPDGLEKVAERIGFIDTAKEHAISDSPLADYGVKGVDNDRVSVGLSGVIGVLITGGVA
jgi:cobalt/nickel transport protein